MDKTKTLDFEKALLEECSVAEPWILIEKFSKLNRVSGSRDEKEAANYLIRKLREWNIPTEVFEPELYLSIPLSSRLEVVSPEKREIKSRPQSFSASKTVEGALVYVQSEHPKSTEHIFEAKFKEETSVEGAVALLEGLSIMPEACKFLEKKGAIAQIWIQPGERIHEGIATSIWGTPTLENIDTKPKTPIININKSDGEYLKKRVREASVRVRIETHLEEGWKKCVLPVAEIKGRSDPEKFVLVHGHYDSWYYGVGDNATGDATLLEIARVFNKFKNKLERSLRVAWWPGHSTGRYAGSTWYVDNFGLDIEENCIAQIDCDSPGCRWATAYEDLMCMKEAEEFCKKVVRDVAGKEAKGIRPIRAGDYSFNNIGVTSFYMLSSNIPKKLRDEKKLYSVGGCGGNIEWHTEADCMEIADKENLLRDIKVYAASILRVLNSDVYPFDFRKTVEELIQLLNYYAEESDSKFDLTPVANELSGLMSDLEEFYSLVGKTEDKKNQKKMREANEIIIRLGRILIPIDFAKTEMFEHDPAISLPPMPEIEPIRQLLRFTGDEDDSKFLKNQLLRSRNKIVSKLRRARDLVRTFEQ